MKNIVNFIIEARGKKRDTSDIKEWIEDASKHGNTLSDEQLEELLIIIREYFKWIDDDLFECRVKELQNPSRILFGTVMHDEITNQDVVILCEGTKKYRKDKYFKVIDKSENIYITRMDFLTPND